MICPKTLSAVWSTRELPRLVLMLLLKDKSKVQHNWLSVYHSTLFWINYEIIYMLYVL